MNYGDTDEEESDDQFEDAIGFPYVEPIKILEFQLCLPKEFRQKGIRLLWYYLLGIDVGQQQKEIGRKPRKNR